MVSWLGDWLNGWLNGSWSGIILLCVHVARYSKPVSCVGVRHFLLATLHYCIMAFFGDFEWNGEFEFAISKQHFDFPHVSYLMMDLPGKRARIDRRTQIMNDVKAIMPEDFQKLTERPLALREGGSQPSPCEAERFMTALADGFFDQGGVTHYFGPLYFPGVTPPAWFQKDSTSIRWFLRSEWLDDRQDYAIFQTNVESHGLIVVRNIVCTNH